MNDKPDTVEIKGKTYEVSGYADDGLPIIKAEVTTSEDGVDENGIPKKSVKVNVPPADLLGTPGEVT